MSIFLQRYEHACAIDTSNQTVCWGYGGYGYETLMTPDEDLSMMDVGDDFACGIDIDGELRCWGTVIAIRAILIMMVMEMINWLIVTILIVSA